MSVPHYVLEDESEDRKIWLERRRQGIGASDAAPALGLSKWKSPLTLWAEKCGFIQPEPANEHTYWGNIIEPLVVAEYSRRSGNEVYDPGTYTSFQHTGIDFLFATPDAIIVLDPEDGLPLEAKHTDRTNERFWVKGPPLEHQIQNHMQMEVMGSPSGVIAALIGKQFEYWPIERNQRFIDAMLIGLEQFWGYVQRKEPPPISWQYDTKKTIAEMYPEDSGLTIGAIGNDLGDWAEKWLAAREEEKAAQRRKYEAQNNIAMLMGEATWARLSDGSRLQLKLEKRKGYVREVEPWEGRVLRKLKK